MNKKLAKGAVAGGAALALIAGGSTFAAWTDFAEVTGNESGAGVLTLDVTAKDGTPTFTIDDMVPGGANEQNIYLVNRDADAVPLANLAMSFQNVVEHENGCSSNSEALADPNCGDAADGGEFGAQAVTQILRSAPGTVNSAADCPASGVYGSLTPGTHNRSLSEVLAHPSYNIGDLGPGEGVCLRMSVSFPLSATDSSQGDSTSYDVRFDLTQ